MHIHCFLAKSITPRQNKIDRSYTTKLQVSKWPLIIVKTYCINLAAKHHNFPKKHYIFYAGNCGTHNLHFIGPTVFRNKMTVYIMI